MTDFPVTLTSQVLAMVPSSLGQPIRPPQRCNRPRRFQLLPCLLPHANPFKSVPPFTLRYLSDSATLLELLLRSCDGPNSRPRCSSHLILQVKCLPLGLVLGSLGSPMILVAILEGLASQIPGNIVLCSVCCFECFF